jgi:SAM-dependent methyltransferase
MAMERNDIIAAYRYLLDREPEAPAVIDRYLDVEHWRALRHIFVSSREFNTQAAARNGDALIGRHLEVAEDNIEVVADKISEQAMFDRIAANWRRFGETEPHYSVLTNPIFKPETIEVHMREFLESGHLDVQRLLNFPRRAGLAPSLYRRALDFGCGVGRLSAALSPYAEEVVGVDISAGHLREGKRILANAGANNVNLVLMFSIDDIDQLGQFDLVISRIVLQHNPPPIMAAIYRKLLQRLAPGGCAVIQIPTYIAGYRFSVQEYLASDAIDMEMNALPQHVIFKIVAEEGCRVIEVREDDHLGAIDGLSHVIAVTRPVDDRSGEDIGMNLINVRDNASDDFVAGTMSFSNVVQASFQAALRRDIEPGDLAHFVEALRNGFPLKTMLSDLIASDEFIKVHQSPLVVTLPSLLDMYPNRYYRNSSNNLIFPAKGNEDIDFLEDAINKYRYYDSFGIWTSEINLDKRVTANIIDALGAKSCLEIGCYNGSVLGLLDETGIKVCGVDISHRAFLLADQRIHQRLRYGDILDLPFDKAYESVLVMDLLEHLNPSKLDRYIQRIASLLSAEGTLYVNSPMFGADRVFQEVFSCYVDEWTEVGDADYWRHIHCDEMGWPVHGHLVWASPTWWEGAFAKHGLVRDTDAEIVVQTVLADFFLHHAPARKSLFILRHRDARPINAAELGTRLLERVSSSLHAQGLERF